MSMKIEAACGCNIGRIRSNNEDNLYFNGLILEEKNIGLKDIVRKKFHIDSKPFFAFLMEWAVKKREKQHLILPR